MFYAKAVWLIDAQTFIVKTDYCDFAGFAQSFSMGRTWELGGYHVARLLDHIGIPHSGISKGTNAKTGRAIIDYLDDATFQVTEDLIRIGDNDKEGNRCHGKVSRIRVDAMDDDLLWFTYWHLGDSGQEVGCETVVYRGRFTLWPDDSPGVE